MRTAELERVTKETSIQVKIDLDGTGKSDISTGIGFFDHMLTALALHSKTDITLRCSGDLEVDCHHSVEDTGIVLGQALAQALGDKSGIARYGSAAIPMDESLAFCSLDISGRPFLVFRGQFINERIGQMDSCMVEEFMRAFAFNSGITLHMNIPYGANDHHKCEAAFKALAHALQKAKAPEDGVLSTKGVL